jgi:hypothetical protein
MTTVINKLNLKRMQSRELLGSSKYFIVINSKGAPLIRLPFMTQPEKQRYEERLQTAREKMLMSHQKELEESTNELEF